MRISIARDRLDVEWFNFVVSHLEMAFAIIDLLLSSSDFFQHHF